MNIVDFYINRTAQDQRTALQRFGVHFDSSALSALLTPNSLKDYVSNESILEHGKQMVGTPKVQARNITITMYMLANSLEEFNNRYSALCAVFEAGEMAISTTFQPNVIYHCLYQSCTQFSQFNGKLAKFQLKLLEPNPKNRS